MCDGLTLRLLPDEPLTIRHCSYFSVEEMRSIIAEGFSEYRQVRCSI
jgi:hypothetical protein